MGAWNDHIASTRLSVACYARYGPDFANREDIMKTIILAVSLSLLTSSAFATCKSDAESKKLAGAALKSFMTKCEKDANTACAADSAAKKLAGAAKTSHMKKCVSDATGI
jgi:hypothetical protein